MIKYLRLLGEYLFKKKTLLLLCATIVLPCILFGVFLRPMEELWIIANIDTARLLSFFDVYLHATGFDSYPIPTLLCLILLACTIAVVVATVDRHLRIGELKFRNPLKRINENFWVVFPILLSLILLKEVFDILALLFAYLWLSTTSGAITTVLILLSYGLVYFVYIALTALLMMWIPHSLNTGLSVARSLASSVKTARTHSVSMTMMIVVPAILLAGVNFLGIWLGGVVNMITSAVTYFFFILYLVVAMYVVYYDAMGYEREDLNKVSIWDKSKSFAEDK